MKKFIVSLAAIAALTACSGPGAGKGGECGEDMDARLARVSTFEDSLAIVDGTFMGTYFRAQLQRPGAPEAPDMKEVIRGIRHVMACDTANRSYLLGLQMGNMAYNAYLEHARNENVDLELLMRNLTAALECDSVDMKAVEPLYAEFEKMSGKVNSRAKERAAAAAYNTDEAVAHRQAAERRVARMQNDPAYRPVGDGMYVKVMTEGDTVALRPDSRVNVSYIIKRLDGDMVRNQPVARATFVGSPANPVVGSVLPYMTVGETAEFYVPYQQAYGELGDKNVGVGPYESLIVEVTVSPLAQPKR